MDRPVPSICTHTFVMLKSFRTSRDPSPDLRTRLTILFYYFAIFQLYLSPLWRKHFSSALHEGTSGLRSFHFEGSAKIGPRVEEVRLNIILMELFFPCSFRGSAEASLLAWHEPWTVQVAPTPLCLRQPCTPPSTPSSATYEPGHLRDLALTWAGILPIATLRIPFSGL